jgi:hypothetical protein
VSVVGEEWVGNEGDQGLGVSTVELADDKATSNNFSVQHGYVEF